MVDSSSTNALQIDKKDFKLRPAVKILIVLTLASQGVVTFGDTSPALAAQRTPEEVEVEKFRQGFLDDESAPTIKPKGYDVTIVEYMDYQCPFCRASLQPIKQLLAQDKKVRIIFRDWPIFGPASERAARLAIASQWQGKHTSFHDALMTTPQPLTELKIKAAAKKAGLDWPRLEKDLKTRASDVEALLKRNNDQAEALGLEGTPGFIIGDVLSFGGMNLAALQKAVKRARQSSGKPKKLISQRPEGI